MMTEAERMLLQLLHFQMFTCLTKRTQMTFSFKEGFQLLCVYNRKLEIETKPVPVTGITGWIPLQTSDQGLVQSLCLLLLPIRSCKNLITVKMNHWNWKLRSPTAPLFVCGITEASAIEETMLSDVLNLVVLPKKAAASPANILRLIQFRNFCCCRLFVQRN